MLKFHAHHKRPTRFQDKTELHISHEPRRYSRAQLSQREKYTFTPHLIPLNIGIEIIQTMSYEAGLVKYLLYTPITAVGAASMYIYGGGIVTLICTLPHLISGDYCQACVEYFLSSALPPTSLGQIIEQILAGTVAAGAKWYVAMNLLR